MDACSSCGSEYDGCERDLEGLYDAFGLVCSLEEIASAYCQAGRNVDSAGEILCSFQQGNCSSVTHTSNGEASGAKSQELLHKKYYKRSNLAQKNSKGLKHKRSSVSIGTVSSVLGKEYIRPSSGLNELCKTKKPLKLELKEPLITELGSRNGLKLEPQEPLTAEIGSRNGFASDYVERNEPMNNKDVEEFLYSMLGDAFQLSMDAIREVLGYCGYNAKKSMEKLLDLSTLVSHKNKVALGITSEKEHLKAMDFSQSEGSMLSNGNGTESHGLDKERNLSREVLEALFNAPEKPEEAPKRIPPVRAVRSMRAAGRTVVTEPPPADDTLLSNGIVEPLQDIDDAEEDNYQVHRRTAKQNWDVMKSYYEAAVDAYTKGNRTEANYLLEQGKFYNKKAREADEKSAGEIFEIRNKDTRNEVTLDLHDHHPQEAIRLLKFHLKNLASIPSIQFLKVIVETNNEDSTKGTRKRLVMKLLEKKSIAWTEEEGKPGTILIQIDIIDPNKLSISKSLQ